MLHGYVGDVCTPHLVGMVYCHVPQQIRVEVLSNIGNFGQNYNIEKLPEESGKAFPMAEANSIFCVSLAGNCMVYFHFTGRSRKLNDMPLLPHVEE